MESISSRFAERFGRPPEVVVRAPGRVNLIGEHTDYSLLPVLPIAIDRAVRVAAATRSDGRVVAASALFADEVDLGRDGPLPAEGWGRYVAGALAELVDVVPGAGADVLVESDLPSSGGLSSSSALTCALVVGLAQAWGTPLSADEAVGRAVSAERHTGVETGGMDQAAIVHGREGQAVRIDFLPPSRRYVDLPSGLRLVAAYSGEPAPKGGQVREAYNQRVVGTRIAAALLGDILGVEPGEVMVLGQVAGFAEAEFLAEELPASTTARQAARQLHLLEERFTRLSHGRLDGDLPLPVRAYAHHVLSESRRVDEAEAALRDGDLQTLGGLLDASHASLRDHFGCSTPALNRLCRAMRRAGALGARLTGAGFGGFAIAACTDEHLEPVARAAEAETGGPAFEVRAAGGLEAGP